nr:hypothetical protein [uncultured Roseococcus sp.]
MPNDSEAEVEFDLKRLREVREAPAEEDSDDVGDRGEHSNATEVPSRSAD